jgi:hypothetical protein
MAGEYSRELSAKVFAGQCRLIELGFRQGRPGRLWPAPHPGRSERIRQKRAGARRAQEPADRPRHPDAGPGRRSRIVNQIYRWFIDDGLSNPRSPAASTP